MASAAAEGCEVQVTGAHWTRWCSATFVGARHRLALRAAPGDRLTRWLASVAAADLPLPEHLLADLSVVSITPAGDMVDLALEALTVEQA